MLVKIKNNEIEKYPYSIEQLRQEYPNTSFPSDLSDELLKEYGVYKVESTTPPAANYTEVVTEGNPVKIDGTWKQTWNIKIDTLENQLLKIQALRKSEYPPIEDYIDGVVKGDTAQIEKYINDCLAIKAKYPKP